MADEKLVKARVVGVDNYGWQDRHPDGTLQPREAAKGDIIEVTEAELARGESLGGALLRESEAKRADADAGNELSLEELQALDLSKLTVPRLRQVAAGLPIDDLPEKASKDELVQLIADAIGVLADSPPAPPDA